ncbi:hypothetical protein JCM17846_33240 [Iodidimonas nitroreducens]|uniref:Arc-like DNA binding domain-containing protein n=1 Tax=Iodidimonas nitroreducens TaxID=1236968 RepID=A0A5A7NBK8_9PROT|nr:hypothetical protein AQ1_02233 [alpha proteobacterium Q-1]GER05642.1 hypothetical protein JCM17846_33240 [Iodidimonas nitroreducens]
MTKAEPKRDDRIRQSIRLAKELWDGIDQARSERPGSISRNTWITEAVLEKLERDVANARAGRAANA